MEELDALESIGLGTTGLLLRRRDPRAALAASVTATLLLVDAWFDVMTAATGAERATAAAMALGIELPLAALLAVVAPLTHRQQIPAGPDDLGQGGDHLGHPGPLRGDDGLLGRAELEHAFAALGDRLVRRDVVADLFIVGGDARHSRPACATTASRASAKTGSRQHGSHTPTGNALTQRPFHAV